MQYKITQNNITHQNTIQHKTLQNNMTRCKATQNNTTQKKPTKHKTSQINIHNTKKKTSKHEFIIGNSTTCALIFPSTLLKVVLGV